MVCIDRHPSWVVYTAPTRPGRGHSSRLKAGTLAAPFAANNCYSRYCTWYHILYSRWMTIMSCKNRFSVIYRYECAVIRFNWNLAPSTGPFHPTHLLLTPGATTGIHVGLITMQLVCSPPLHDYHQGMQHGVRSFSSRNNRHSTRHLGPTHYWMSAVLQRELCNVLVSMVE